MTETSETKALGVCPECNQDFDEIARVSPYAKPSAYQLEQGGVYTCPKCHYALILVEDAEDLTRWTVVPNLGSCAHCHEPFAKTPNRPFCLDDGDFHYCGACGWRNVRDASVEGLWVEAETYDQHPEIATKTVHMRIPTYEQFVTSLDRRGLETVRKVGAENARAYSSDRKLDLWTAYRNEVMSLVMAAIDPNCKEPSIYLGLFDCSPYSSQRIANLHCSDLAKPVANAYNFHGQNVSQWSGHAGCVLVDEESISTHH